MSFAVGDVVGVNYGATDVYGTSLAPFVYDSTYDVIQVGGEGLDDDRIVIGVGSAVTAAVDASDLYLISASGEHGADISDDTPDADYIDPNIGVGEDEMTSAGIEATMMGLMAESIQDNGKGVIKNSMRLFGLPYQFTKYVDNRIDGINQYVGRKFIENIILEAPVITVIPGKPKFLPSAKNRKGTGASLLAGASAAISDVTSKFISAALDNESENKYLRYYDFQSSYNDYIKYVNVMCRAAAAFLDLADKKNSDGTYKYTINGTVLTKYDWANYRWNADSWSGAVGKAITADKGKLGKGIINYIKQYGSALLQSFDLKQVFSTDNTVQFDEPTQSDKDAEEEFASVLEQTNFVQFFIDNNSSFSDGNSNSVGESRLSSSMNSGSDVTNEVAFLANSGGFEWDQLEALGSSGLDQLANALTSNTNGGISTAFTRILSAGSSIIKGDRLIVPKIYNSSDYRKSYTVNLTLKTPYGNKYNYYMDILVPLMHILALSLPHQTTANTSASPFLVKVYLPGVFACNLGMITEIAIDKNPSAENWSIDGLPMEINVQLTIEDLYSSLTITQSSDPLLFISNSSLVDYLAVACGIDLVQPQLGLKAKYYADIFQSSVADIVTNIKTEVETSVANKLQSYFRID